MAQASRICFGPLSIPIPHGSRSLKPMNEIVPFSSKPQVEGSRRCNGGNHHRGLLPKEGLLEDARVTTEKRDPGPTWTKKVNVFGCTPRLHQTMLAASPQTPEKAPSGPKSPFGPDGPFEPAGCGRGPGSW